MHLSRKNKIIVAVLCTVTLIAVAIVAVVFFKKLGVPCYGHIHISFLPPEKDGNVANRYWLTVKVSGEDYRDPSLIPECQEWFKVENFGLCLQRGTWNDSVVLCYEGPLQDTMVGLENVTIKYFDLDRNMILSTGDKFSVENVMPNSVYSLRLIWRAKGEIAAVFFKT